MSSSLPILGAHTHCASIMGSTYTGTFESVQGMADELDKYQERTGDYVAIHVDAASGGFMAPFAYPDYKWDFAIPRVERSAQLLILSG